MPPVPDPGVRAARAVRVRELFALAVDTAPEQRDSRLALQTGDDASLLEEVRALLAAHADASGLFSSPTIPAARIAPSHTASIGSRIGHYRIDAWIGAGGMGDVFKAWDLALDRPAAVKLIRSDMVRHQTMRLLREVDAAAQLQHPAIATFFEGGEDQGTVYLAMELIEGTTLRHRLADGPMPPTEALTLLTGLLEALAHAHAAGLLHRDIKPENVMITSAGLPKLLDFGIARHLAAVDRDDQVDVETQLAPSLTAGGTAGAAGTPGYMSPEQLRGEMLTPASDVFQAGALLFEMLTGRRVFGDGSPVARIAATLAGPPDLTPVARLEPHGLSTVVAKALAFDPVDRFDSAAGFLRHVDALLEGRVRHALPESLVVAGFQGPEQDWIGHALSESLGRFLGQLRNVRVMGGSRIAAMLASGTAGSEARVDPVQLALMLGVRWVVAGAYERDGDRLHVRVRLLDASTGSEVGVSNLTGTIDGILSDPAGLAASIVDALPTGRPEPLVNPSVAQSHVVELQLKARQLWQSGTRDSHPRVFSLLEEALEISPDFVPALALIAAARATSFIATRDGGDLAKAIAAADRAIAVDPSCAEAWSWRAYALLRQARVEEALQSYDRATRAGEDPTASYLYGSTLASLGRFEEALPHLQAAVTLEPRYGIGWLSLGWALHSLLRPEAARYAMTRAKALEGQPGPTFVAGVGGYLAECLRSLGQLDAARGEALEGLQSIESSDHSYRDTIRAFCLVALGRVCLDQGDAAGAGAAFTQAVAQMRGRTLTLAGGHVFVQALAGLARATRDREVLDEAIGVFTSRQGYSFNAFFGCADDTTAFELAVSADALGLAVASERLLTQARAAGNRRPFSRAQIT